MRMFGVAAGKVQVKTADTKCVYVWVKCEDSEKEMARTIRLESDGLIEKISNRLVVVKRLKPLMALSGTVYRLASSMSDHTPVLFNVFEDWNEKSVLPHLCFVSFVINY